MKLRLKGNGLRLRLNQTEVRRLATGNVLSEKLDFPGGSSLTYVLASGTGEPQANFVDGAICVTAPAQFVNTWASGEDVGMYFDLPAAAGPLRIAIEKDLECIDGPAEDRDPDAFPRMSQVRC